MLRKRIVSVFLVFCLCLSIMPRMSVEVNAYTEGTDGMGPVVITGGQRDFRWPVPGYYNLQSCFYDQRNHCAIDISAGRGTSVIAAYQGTVVATYTGCSHNYSKSETCCNDGFGNYVVLSHNYRKLDGTMITLYSRYSHLTSVYVSVGASVSAGDSIGTIGCTGYSQGFHLDFQILYGNWKPYRTYSIDPYSNQLLELPSNLQVYDSWNCGKTYYALITEVYAVPICSHPSYDSLGVCTSCGAVYDWESTYNTEINGRYQVIKSFTPRTDKPYDSATKADYQIDVGEEVEVLAYYVNAFDNVWLKFIYNGEVGYVYQPYLEYVGIAELRVTCSDFSPADQALLEKKAQPVIGTVRSNYPLAAIYAYLDGEQYTSWHAGNNSTTEVSLRETDINYALPFGSLSDGKHTIELIAHSFVHENGVNFHSSVFYINEKTEIDTRPGKPTLRVTLSGNLATFTWDATANTTHYNLWLGRMNSAGEWEEEPIFYAENGMSKTLQNGEYCAQLLSYNSNAWEPDDSDWQHTWADDIYFTIKPDTVTITFDLNGGSWISATNTKTIDVGAQIGIMLPATRSGYKFAGWYLTQNSGYDPVAYSTTFSEDTTLYAHWIKERVMGNKITFATNGGQMLGSTSVNTIDGFNTTRRLKQLIVYNCEGTTVDTNVYGYEVAVNCEGEVVSKRDYGETTALVVPNGGFILSGQLAEGNCGGIFVDSISVGDHVAYDENTMQVLWYTSENAYLAEQKYVMDGSTYGDLPVPEKNGYQFVGWYTAPEGGQQITEDSIYSEAVLYAHWECIHSYINGICNNCGAEDPDYVKPIKQPALTLKYPTLTFEDIIMMNVYFAASDLEDVVEMGLVTYSENVTEGSVVTADTVISGYAWSESDGFYYTTTNGIAAKELGDEIYFAVYAKLTDGSYTYTRVVSYSPVTYAYTSLATGSEAMKPIVVAMLNYGAAAQTYFGYNTDQLVNSGLTDTQQKLVESYRSDMMQTLEDPDQSKLGYFSQIGNISRRGRTVSFEGAFNVSFYCTFATQPLDTVTMYYWNAAAYKTANTLTPENATATIRMEKISTGDYRGTINGIAAKDLDKSFYVAFAYSDADTQYATDLQAYSIGTYCTISAEKENAIAPFAAATAVYGYYANKLFN